MYYFYFDLAARSAGSIDETDEARKERERERKRKGRWGMEVV